MKRVRRTILVLAIASCLAGASVPEASATNWTFVPFARGDTDQGSGTASSIYSANDKGDEALDVQAQAATLDQNSTGASAVATVGGSYQLLGDFAAGDYVATVTLSNVNATATGTGSGYGVVQFYPQLSCNGCNVTSTKWPTICACPDIVSSLPIDGPLTPPRVSDATYTFEMSVTLQQAQSLVEVGGSTDGYASSAEEGLNYGRGRAQLTGSIRHVSLRRVH